MFDRLRYADTAPVPKQWTESGSLNEGSREYRLRREIAHREVDLAFRPRQRERHAALQACDPLRQPCPIERESASWTEGPIRSVEWDDAEDAEASRVLDAPSARERNPLEDHREDHVGGRR